MLLNNKLNYPEKSDAIKHEFSRNGGYNNPFSMKIENMFFNRFKAVLFFILLFSCWPLAAAQPPLEDDSDKMIQKIYRQLNSQPPATMSDRIEFISAELLDQPYLLGALGEGIKGTYDQSPIYRTDAFDCETYVDVVLAIALADTPETFQHRIRQIRYKNGQVSFLTRNHFLSLDWNQNNQRQGFIQDYTQKIKNRHNQPIAKTTQALINKPAWYQHFNVERIKINALSETERLRRLNQLKQAGQSLESIVATIDYIPLSVLFDPTGKPDLSLFNQIPNAAIVEIIRPNWDLRKQIGTCLNASHLGFAIWKNNQLMFRQASSIHGKTVDESLIDYLRQTLKSPTIKGIHIEVVVPEKPLSGGPKSYNKSQLPSSDYRAVDKIQY